MTDEKKCPCEAMMEAQKRIREHDSQLHNGEVTFAVIDQKLDNIERGMAELKADVKEIMIKPARRWDKVVEYVLLAIIACLLAGVGIG